MEKEALIALCPTSTTGNFKPNLTPNHHGYPYTTKGLRPPTHAQLVLRAGSYTFGLCPVLRDTWARESIISIIRPDITYSRQRPYLSPSAYGAKVEDSLLTREVMKISFPNLALARSRKSWRASDYS